MALQNFEGTFDNYPHPPYWQLETCHRCGVDAVHTLTPSFSSIVRMPNVTTISFPTNVYNLARTHLVGADNRVHDV